MRQFTPIEESFLYIIGLGRVHRDGLERWPYQNQAAPDNVARRRLCPPKTREPSTQQTIAVKHFSAFHIFTLQSAIGVRARQPAADSIDCPHSLRKSLDYNDAVAAWRSIKTI